MIKGSWASLLDIVSKDRTVILTIGLQSRASNQNVGTINPLNSFWVLHDFSEKFWFLVIQK